MSQHPLFPIVYPVLRDFFEINRDNCRVSDDTDLNYSEMVNCWSYVVAKIVELKFKKDVEKSKSKNNITLF